MAANLTYVHHGRNLRKSQPDPQALEGCTLNTRAIYSQNQVGDEPRLQGHKNHEEALKCPRKKVLLLLPANHGNPVWLSKRAVSEPCLECHWPIRHGGTCLVSLGPSGTRGSSAQPPPCTTHAEGKDPLYPRGIEPSTRLLLRTALLEETSADGANGMMTGHLDRVWFLSPGADHLERG